MDRQQEFVLRTLEERDIRFVRLWFTDVLGNLKSFSINSSELERAFERGIGFDGASLTGFNPVEEQLIVGAQWPRELVLQRTVPLSGADHGLNGIVTPAGSPNTLLTRVKIEVVDGPLAGVFTFTDDDSGTYMLRSLPTGIVQVRASYGGRTQTVTVDLAASMTYLPFVF